MEILEVPSRITCFVMFYELHQTFYSSYVDYGSVLNNNFEKNFSRFGHRICKLIILKNALPDKTDLNTWLIFIYPENTIDKNLLNVR